MEEATPLALLVSRRPEGCALLGAAALAVRFGPRHGFSDSAKPKRPITHPPPLLVARGSLQLSTAPVIVLIRW